MALPPDPLYWRGVTCVNRGVVIVTGTKRSGTSMWMQILIAAGFPSVGSAFPGIWEQTIRSANVRGFYESKFRQGVYFATNPDPETGAFVTPEQVRRHVVKVFIPGLVRTDYSYIGRVVATMRQWREYGTSLHRLFAMEDAFRAELQARGEAVPERSFPDEVVESIVRAGQLPPALEWWFENYDLIRNAVTRRYPFHLTTYDRLLRAPDAEVTKVIRWLGEGKLEPAIAAVHPELRTQVASSPEVDELVGDHAGLFDELYDRVDQARSLDAAFIAKLNETNETLTARWEEIAKQRLAAVRSGVDPAPR
jgi:hypothetical protein